MAEHDGLGERLATLEARSEAQWTFVSATLQELRADVKTLLADRNRSAGRWAGWVAGAAAVTSSVGVLIALNS